jgi:hypothetical protein
VEPEPDPEPFMPGQFQQEQPTQEDFWRYQYQQQQDQLQRQQYELQQYQLAGLSEEEQLAYRQQAQAQQERAAMQQQLDIMQRNEAIREWREYCYQFLPQEDNRVDNMDDPIRMLHYTNSNMQARLRQLEKENQTLKAATTTTQPGPPVTTGGAGAPARRSLADLSEKEFEDLHRQALRGELSDGDIPPAS